MLKLFQKIETAVSYILSNSINEKKFLKKKLNKKKIIVIDIGANVGSYLDFIIKNSSSGDVILIMSSGDFGGIHQKILEGL